jgi:Arc/MetJ-type ribon-helix-helix transcriptional regulator
MEEKLLVRLSGATVEILNELVKRGYFSTKSEAIRAGILKLGESLMLIRPSSSYWKELEEEIKKSGKRMTHEEIVEAIASLKREA